MRSVLRAALIALGLLTWHSIPVFAQQSVAITTTTCAAGVSTATGCALFPVSGMGTAGVQITGTWVGTITFEGSIKGTTFSVLGCTSTAPSSSPASTTTANGFFTCPVAGMVQLKVSFTAYTSGTANVDVLSAPGGGGSGGGGASGSVSITQGGNTAAVNASSQLSVTCANCSGSGVSVLEDAASADGAAGTPAYAVRKATPANTSGTDGDYEALQMSAGRLWTSSTIDAALPAGTNAIGKLAANAGVTIGAVEIAGAQTLAVVSSVTTVDSVTALGTITPGTAATNLGKAEDAVVGSGDVGVAMLAQRSDTPASTNADGDYGHVKLDSVGRLWVNCGTGCSGGTQYAEDAVHASGDTGTLALAVRRDTAASSSGTDGDNSTLNVDASGRMWTNIFGVTQAATSYLTMRISDGSGYITPATDSTHDGVAGSTGPQIMAGAAAALSAHTAVADGDAVRLAADVLGRTLTAGPCDRSDRLGAVTTVTDGSSTSAIAASGAGIYNEIWDAIIANTSATAVTVDIRDGTAGSVMATFPVPANTAGVVHRFAVPLTGTANTAVAVDPSAAASSIIVTLRGCKAK